ncbi:hypothetical protein LEP1GSC047_0066 [Leptospira inadai serovar Lyme str. 10]|uniref:Uncharacterized protein n=2 Tax=Leptospira inadai serovar Lyme TaxID=293084 RepID=V6HE24_9LEPT|nr:hypothetical protein [Leptospira inadai]EQA38242.1 hypothetical protein LEP1GSC047_0066 [Leptospira inadai serovar Lyme str. 10]PNV74005.1 hypothetical protein BES34_015725 [Leptospira inadai serovar Lyme]
MLKLEFGKYEASMEEESFHKLFNGAILNLCNELPASLRTETLRFLKEYSGCAISNNFDFFNKYNGPCYTIIYWINERAHNLSWDDPWLTLLIQSHSSALLLYSLDDHLVDKSLRTSGTLLQLRTQAWEKYSQAGRLFDKEIHKASLVREEFIDKYFRSIRDNGFADTLEDYLTRFRSQMAIWSLQPYLLARSFLSRAQAESVLKMYESFGIAWRLLEDYRDLGKDIESGSVSSMIYFLPEKVQLDWGKRARVEIFALFEESNLDQKVSDLTNSYLNEAAQMAAKLHLKEYAHCLSSMRLPIVNFSSVEHKNIKT